MAMANLARRDELLESALIVIQREGPNASMEAMAAEAGITKPILYRHFGDRDGLIAAMASRFGRQLVERLSAVLAEPASPRERIEAAVGSYVSFIEEDPALYVFLTQQGEVLSLVESGVIERVASLLAGAISDTMAAAGLPARPTETWAYGVVGMMHLAGARWAATPGQSRQQLVADLVSLVADGLLGATAVEAVAPSLR